MRQLKAVTYKTLDFMDDIIKSKRKRKGDDAIIAQRSKCKTACDPIPADLTFKEHCEEVRSKNESEINKYDNEYASDSLDKVSLNIPNVVVTLVSDKDDFISLYDYGAKKIKDLRKDILKGVDTFCPICGFNKVNTMDHYLPKEKYPLFCIHPRNLIPCCSECNSHKHENVFNDNGSRMYWNAYLDVVPDEQFLFFKVKDENNIPSGTFYLKQGNIKNNLWAIIRNTFNDIHLIDTYNENISTVVNEMRNAVCNNYRSNKNSKSLDECISSLDDNIAYSDNQNEWRYVLKKALVMTEIFKICIKTDLKNLYGITV